MAVENSTLFSLNIGESLTNNAWGNGRWEGGSKGRSKERWGRREGGRWEGGSKGRSKEGWGRREGAQDNCIPDILFKP